MNPDELYRTGMGSQRFGWFVRPIRRILFRLLRPYLLTLLRTSQQQLPLPRSVPDQAVADMTRHLATLDARQHAFADSLAAFSSNTAGLGERIDDLTRSVARLEGSCEALDARTRSVAALAWDREAVVRRLAAIEDALLASAERRETVDSDRRRS